MRIVFMGSPDFALPSLEKIHQSDHSIVGVVSNVDKRRGRGGETSPTPVKEWAKNNDLNVITVENLDDTEFHEQLKDLEPDLFVVVAFRILPPEVLEIPRIGSINLHASLLPKYRGAAPIHWAVMNGEEKTGCSIFFLEEDVDTGAIIKQEPTSIGPNETTGDVYKRLKVLGAEILHEAIYDIESGDYEKKPQQDELATPAPKLFSEDCLIDVHTTAPDLHNKIRGLSPFPTAWTTLDGTKFNLYRSELGPYISLAPGRLKEWKENLLLGTDEGTVNLIKVQLAGRKKMSGIEFLNGYSGPMSIDSNPGE